MEKIAIVEETEKKKKKKKFNRRMRMKTIEKAPITIRNKLRIKTKTTTKATLVSLYRQSSSVLKAPFGRPLLCLRVAIL